MPGSLPNLLAGGGPIGSWEPTHLFSGDADIHTDGGVAGANFAIYTVLAVTAAGLLVPHAPAATDGTEVAMFVALEAGVSGQKVPYYTAGQFNPDALVWDASLTTFEQRQAAFRNSPSAIIIKKVI